MKSARAHTFGPAMETHTCSTLSLHFTLTANIGVRCPSVAKSIAGCKAVKLARSDHKQILYKTHTKIEMEKGEKLGVL